MGIVDADDIIYTLRRSRLGNTQVLSLFAPIILHSQNIVGGLVEQTVSIKRKVFYLGLDAQLQVGSQACQRKAIEVAKAFEVQNTE